MMVFKEKIDVLGEITWYSKFELAEQQLQRAITLYLDEKDYVSAITLAGAAEELLGKILNDKKIPNDLDEAKELFRSAFSDSEWVDNHEKWFVKDVNYYRDNLKHFEVKSPRNAPGAEDVPLREIGIFAQAAQNMIDRALNNYSKFPVIWNEKMNRYYDSIS